MRITDTHVYFWSGIYSQWHISRFSQALEKNGKIFEFNCAEQYMMASKAHMFGDTAALKRIMKSDSPKEQKSLGRSVKNFDERRWNSGCMDVVFRGNWAKFSQNADFGDELCATDDRIIVEGSPYDVIWGVGLAWDDPKIENKKHWRGKNKLGICIMDVRAALVDLRNRKLTDITVRYDEWSRKFG